MTKDDYLVWRDNPVTQEFMEEVVKSLNIEIADLVNFAGENQHSDLRRRGRIEGLKWLMEWVPVVEREEKYIDGTDSEGTPDSD